MENITEEQKFYKFVNEQIEKLKKYSELNSDDLKFDDLNRVLCNYGQIYFTLLSLYTFSQTELKLAKEEFDCWYADKFVSIRERENRIELAAQKWLSYKEIEMLLRKENKVEYIGKKQSLSLIEQRVEFVQQMIKTWESQQYILSTLSKNIQTEVSVAIKN
jgi:hypothetical protein